MKKLLLVVLMALFVMTGCEEQVTDMPPTPPSPMKYGSASATHPTFDASTLKTDVPGDFQVDGTLTATGGVTGALTLINGDDIKLSTTTDGHEFSLGVYDTNDTTWRYLTLENGDSSQAAATDWPRIDIPSGVAITGIDDFSVGGDLSITGGIEVAQQELGDGAGQTVSPNGATALTSTAGGAESGTLGDATYIGQIKTIVMAVDGGVSWVVTVSHLDTGDDSTLTFNDVDEVWVGLWTGTEWTTLRNTID
jgi:hypothetical protein